MPLWGVQLAGLSLVCCRRARGAAACGAPRGLARVPVARRLGVEGTGWVSLCTGDGTTLVTVVCATRVTRGGAAADSPRAAAGALSHDAPPSATLGCT